MSKAFIQRLKIFLLTSNQSHFFENSLSSANTSCETLVYDITDFFLLIKFFLSFHVMILWLHFYSRDHRLFSNNVPSNSLTFFNCLCISNICVSCNCLHFVLSCVYFITLSTTTLPLALFVVATWRNIHQSISIYAIFGHLDVSFLRS